MGLASCTGAVTDPMLVAATAPTDAPAEPRSCASSTARRLAEWDGLTHLLCAAGTSRCGSRLAWEPRQNAGEDWGPADVRVWEDRFVCLEETPDFCGKAAWVVAGHVPLPPEASGVALAVDDSTAALRVSCSAQAAAALFLRGHEMADRNAAEHLLKRIDWRTGVAPSIGLAGGSEPLDGWAGATLPAGSAVRSASDARKFALEGDCGPTTIVGTYGEVEVTGWHSELEIGVRDADVVVTLFPGSAAVNHIFLQTNQAIALSLPARSGYQVDVPAGWQIVCPQGLDPACGSMGPRRIGPPGATGAYLAAPRGVVRIYDWVGSSDTSAKEELLPLPGAWLGRDRSLMLDAEPPCRDVLRRECGAREHRECLPTLDVRGRTLAPWIGDLASP